MICKHEHWIGLAIPAMHPHLQLGLGPKPPTNDTRFQARMSKHDTPPFDFLQPLLAVQQMHKYIRTATYLSWSNEHHLGAKLR